MIGKDGQNYATYANVNICQIKDDFKGWTDRWKDGATTAIICWRVIPQVKLKLKIKKLLIWNWKKLSWKLKGWSYHIDDLL